MNALSPANSTTQDLLYGIKSFEHKFADILIQQTNMKNNQLLATCSTASSTEVDSGLEYVQELASSIQELSMSEVQCVQFLVNRYIVF